MIKRIVIGVVIVVLLGAGAFYWFVIRDTPEKALATLSDGLLPEHYEAFTRRWFQGILTGGTDATKRAVLRSLAATRPDVFTAATMGLYSFDPLSALTPYRGPRVHIASFLAENAAAIHRTFKDMPVRVIPGASHWLMLDCPEDFNRALDAFLVTLR
jgi:pimeloyl-ACP methyl ester carboxylesterase